MVETPNEPIVYLNGDFVPLSEAKISVLDQGRVEVIAGVNLPMLIKLASLRETESLAAAVAQAQEAGRKYINVASQLLANKT